MSEKVLFGLEQQTNTFMVPDGFVMDSDSGVCAVDKAVKKQLEDKVRYNSFESREEAEDVTRRFLVADFFDTSRAVNQDVEISFRLARIFHLREYYQQLKELGENPPKDEVEELQRSFDFHPAAYPPSTVLHQLGFSFPDEIEAVYDFVKNNTAFIANIAGLDGTRNLVKRSYAQKAGFLRPDGHVAFIPRKKGGGYETKYEVATGEIDMLTVDRLQNWFKNGYHHLPTLVPRFLQEAVAILPNLENNTISPELQRVILFLLEQKKEAVSVAPEIVPIYDSLLQAIPRYYDNAISYEELMNQVTRSTASGLEQRRTQVVTERTSAAPSLRQRLNELLTK